MVDLNVIIKLYLVSECIYAGIVSNQSTLPIGGHQEYDPPEQTPRGEVWWQPDAGQLQRGLQASGGDVRDHKQGFYLEIELRHPISFLDRH